MNDLAARVDRAQHSMSKHRQILREVGAVVMAPGTDGDGRKLFHAIPPGCLRECVRGKEVDYGKCVPRRSEPAKRNSTADDTDGK